MKLKFKENPKEWRNFTISLTIVLSIIALLLQRRGWLPGPYGAVVLAGLAVITLSAARPRWFRGVYRGGMTVGFYIGQVVGTVLLTLMFLFLVTPLGWLLRLLGKDLLQLKRPARDTFWHTAKTNDHLDRMF